MHRSDDNADTLRKRLQSYHSKTAPVLGYYKQQGVYSAVDANASFAQVYRQLASKIDE